MSDDVAQLPGYPGTFIGNGLTGPILPLRLSAPGTLGQLIGDTLPAVYQAAQRPDQTEEDPRRDDVARVPPRDQRGDIAETKRRRKPASGNTCTPTGKMRPSREQDQDGRHRRLERRLGRMGEEER